MLSFESKASVWEFYNAVARLTDNTGIRVLKNHYESFLHMMKHCSQGHHPGGIKKIEAGTCAVLCPACPHPSKNLPVGWENTEYKDILASRNRVGNAQEVINLADTRASRGLAATGAGTIDCAWHNFKCPCSVGDLQKGERYINMDYLFFSSMHSSHGTFPHKFHLNHNEKVITFLVPKFHLPAHIAPCQTRFSFNFIKGVGQMDGEALERGWADINPLATNTIDDHFNNWNWKKVCAMGE
ncbi:hypothetical protein EV702DRAFT_1180336 [Suillus placidus]|uniref:CxC2-like cysteine cluster KDZ transposase-associated domain-containing protein n=1 Tax=Suillus placidus TaxID=48579 RepID=A0A9P7D0U1_9AGAM|nr:hypothetical protein EV702DRAFT_1180336 [Suillus placidus]